MNIVSHADHSYETIFSLYTHRNRRKMDSNVLSQIAASVEDREKRIEQIEEINRNSTIDPEERESQYAVREAAANAAKDQIETKAAKEEKFIQDKARRDSVGELKQKVEKRETRAKLRKMTEEEQAYEKARQSETIAAAANAASAKKEEATKLQVKTSTEAAIKEAAAVARRKSLTE